MLVDAFKNTGVYALVDGQFGSTGKGLAAAYLAHCLPMDHISTVVSNAGSNSGHTSYFGDKKIVLQQLPTFAVIRRLMGNPVHTVLSAGAVIDPKRLALECTEFGLSPYVHPGAVVITDECKEYEQRTVNAIASTGKGVGRAIALKAMREGTVWGDMYPDMSYRNCVSSFDLRMGRTLLEVSQGFSLGINQRFYPHCTSRECTTAQAFADAGISPKWWRGTVMCLRTFPIRVGNVGNASSGGCYSDQHEIKWEDIGVEPELTTVTGRVRRVFTFSMQQYIDALIANTPTVLFINFLNYLKDGKDERFVDELRHVAHGVLGYTPHTIGGYGPRIEDCEEMLP